MFEFFFSSSPLFPHLNWVLLAIRIIAGTTMIYYGWPKVKGLRANAEWFSSIGFRPGIFWGTVVALVEFAGGIMIILGLYTAVAAALFGFQMVLGTIWKKMKTDKPFTDWSYDLLLLALMLTILAFGPGTYSIGWFFG